MSPEVWQGPPRPSRTLHREQELLAFRLSSQALVLAALGERHLQEHSQAEKGRCSFL